MTLNEFIGILSQSAQNAEDEAFVHRFEAVNAYLLAQAEIRIFIANSQNFGHQSSSVNILRNLIRMGSTANFFLALSGSNPADLADLVDKIKVLIPQFKNLNEPFVLEERTVVAVDLSTDPFTTTIPLALTGGYDHPAEDAPFSRLKVLNYIQLQPYGWTKGPNQVVTLGEPVRIIDLEETYPALLIRDRAFYLADPVVTESDWAAIADSVFREKGEIVNYLLTQASGQNPAINLYPVYGISTPGRYVNPAFSLYNIVAGTLVTQDEHWQSMEFPTVIVLFSKLTNQQWRLFKDLVYDPDRPTGFISGQALNASADFVSWWRDNQVQPRVKDLGGPDMQDPEDQITLQEVMHSVEALQKKQVLVIYLESVPAVLFNELYFKSDFPPVFEGQSTVELMLNLGRPYLKVTNRSHEADAAYGYPTLPLGTAQSGAFAVESNRMSYNGIYFSEPRLWQTGTATYPPTVLQPMFGAYLAPAVEEYAPLAAYFTGLREFYHQQREDKLLRGLDVFVNNIGPAVAGLNAATARSLAVAEEPDSSLEDLYNSINSAIHDGVLNFLQAVNIPIVQVFFSGIIDDQYMTMTGSVVEINDDKTLVTLTGDTTAFGIGKAKLTFLFTMNEDQIQTSMGAALPDSSLSFPGIQWFTFSSPELTLTLNSATAAPVVAQVSIDIAVGITMTISITIPSQPGKMLAQAEFTENKPSISEMFRLIGGINLSAILPDQIRLFADIEAQLVTFTYDYSRNVLEYIGINLGTPPGNTWDLVPGVSISSLTLAAQVTTPADLNKRTTTVTIGGEFNISDATLEISAVVPELRVSGAFKEDSKPLNIGTFIAEFLGQPFADALPSFISTTDVTAMNFLVDKGAGIYSFGMKVETDWKIDVLGTTLFTITELGFDFEAKSRAIDPATSTTPNATAAAPPRLAAGAPASAGTETEVTGNFTGSVVILPDSQKIGLSVAASYLGTNAGWTFEARQTSGTVSFLDLMFGYLPEAWQPDQSVRETFDVLIDGLGIKIATKTNSWEFTGKTATPITIPGTGIDVNLNMRIGYNGASGTQSAANGLAATTVPVRARNGAIVGQATVGEDPVAVGYFGTLSAVVTWENIEITVFYDFNPDYQSFGITWEFLEGKITQKDGKTIATLRFTESTTIGSMVETMVSWATGSTFTLGSPWNILNAIPLNRLSLEYNFTDKQVGLNVGIGPIEMGFARIDSISLTYKSNQPDPQDNGVQVELVGSFRWQQDPNKPLGWNAAKPETTPAPQGQGNKYLDLRLLAMGQHVTYPCFADADTVQKAIACMKTLPQPDPNNIMIPPVQLDANSSWLIGMDFGILRFGPDSSDGTSTVAGTALLSAEADPAAASGYFITMQIVFNDPNLYALRIKLDGDAAKVLKGLDFQIMYKKISDSIGLYKAEITLPDKMRYIRMGQLNVTLPVFGIEYYTNGDFQVDIGFPWNADFSRSLTFQTLIWTPVGIPIPVMGSVGVYFGKLSSATTDRVPKADNGTFNPVLVFGFGIQFGIGYTFDVGILKAGFSLTAVAILEGIVAKFNPYSLSDGSRQLDQVETSYYFWLQGTVGIIGKLFGTVDFAIIKADVNIDIRILASFTFAPYEPIILNLTASVEVSVTVKINLGLFKIKISFSFSAKISQTVTIKGIGGTPPWQVTGGEALLSSMRMVRRRERKRGLQEGTRLTLLAAGTGEPDWNNLQPAATPQSLNGYMTLGLTMAGDMAATPDQQIACYVALLFIDSMAPPQEDRTGGAEKAFADAPDSSFELLAKMVLRWAVAALQPGPVSAEQVDDIIVSDVELQALLDRLSDEDNPTPIPAEDVENFMAGQFRLSVQGPTADVETDATYFPVAPAMRLNVPQYGGAEGVDYTFADYNSTSTDYLKFLRTYFDQLAVKVDEEQEKEEGLKAFAMDDSDGESLGSFIFNDYFLMICRQMLQSAVDSLREFKYYLEDGDTPDVIVAWINENAGLQGVEAYNREELFIDNAGVALTAGKGLRVEGGTYVVQAEDTFNSIAANSLFGGGFSGGDLAAFNAGTDNTLTAGITISYPGKDPYVTQPGESLQTVADTLEVTVQELIANAGIAALPNLPLAVATLQLPGFSSVTGEGDTLRSVAAMFRIDQGALALPDANGTIANLFDRAATDTLDIANLTRFKTGELIKEIQATQGLQHLSGMTSRYYMAGLRLPTDGITPEKKGMWVTGDEPGEYELPEFAGLYALTGQQFEIPALNGTDDFNVDFDNGGLPWLSFVNDDPSKLRISIKPGTDDRKQIDLVRDYATTHRLDTGMSFLGLRGMFDTKAATYSFNSEVDWNAASSFSMPYGGMPPGIPDMQLWLLPDALMALPDLATRKVNPRMAMKIGEYNEAARAMVDRDLNYYGYASMVEFTVKRVPVVEGSPSTATTYEVMGADGNSANVLERIVSEIGNDDGAIQTLILAYPADPNTTTASGIITDPENALTIGLAQVNLSTETRPDTGFNAQLLAAKAEEEGMTLLNGETEFIRLLWEAGITRGGGYYLYYFNSAGGAGLPDRVFNDKGEALLTLIVLYAKPDDVRLQGNIGGYMNALVTGESIDRNSAQLFAEANPNTDVTVSANPSQTLASLAYEYFGNVSQVAADNADLPLRTGLRLAVSEGVYEVGPDAPGGDLNAIADRFGTTPQAIRDANPKVTSWPDPLPLYTALYLPELTLTIGTSKGGTALGPIADYYGMNLTALANHNKELPGIFADGGVIRISGGPVITTSTVPAGNVTVQGVRPKPEEIPDTPSGADYGEIFLLNMFSLLSYQVAQNPYFTSSALGLPATPDADPEEENNVSKVRAPKAIAPGEEWIFNQTVPYNQFAAQVPQAAQDLPDANDSPYRGIGDLLQVDFAWQDLYGNRLITDLSNPAPGDTTPLNMPPILTGYSDPIISLQQWPSVAAAYSVIGQEGVPTINLLITFDSTVYQGLISARVAGATTIEALFTEALDRTTAELPVNYSLDNGITVLSAQLGADSRTVTLTVNTIPTEVEITLTIAGIANAALTQTFQGTAGFFSPESAGLPTSTLLQKSIGDLNTYTQLWYQLTDPYGIAYHVDTSLTVNDYTLDEGQVSTLVNDWLASIWRFVNDRAQGGTTVPAPAASVSFSFPIVQGDLNPDEIYRLELGFTIERTGGAVMGDLETTGGIASTTTAVSPFAGAAGETATDLTTFAQNFEEALLDTGAYQLLVATSVDREASLSSNSGNELWVVRLGLNEQNSISYRINDVGGPVLFAPKPISTKLENRTGVPIWDFNPETGIDFSGPPSRTLDFTGVDMDTWGGQFFSDVDNVLSPEFTAAIQLVDNNKGTDYLQGILDNKREIADIVKDWMDFVFEGESGSTADIREAFRQQILVRLSNAYNVKAGVQYSATVQAGAFRFFFAGFETEYPLHLTLVFTSDIDQSVAENIANYSLSGGPTVTAAVQDIENRQIVTLTLSGPPIAGETEVTVSGTYTDSRGNTIVPPLTMRVEQGMAATPEIFGNIVQNFRFAGAAPNGDDETQLFLFFSGTLDKGTAENVNNYTVSDLAVNSAVLDAANAGLVTLTLSGVPVVDRTTVTVAETFTDAVGQPLLPPYRQTVSANVDVSHRTRGISLTAAKLNLKNADAVPLPFLVSGPQLVRGDSGAVLSYIDLDTTYQGSSIEHQIGTLPNVADYRASTWLSFVSGTETLTSDLGPTQVPMILRSFPASPSMVEQTGASSYPISPDDLEKILQWNYSINYSQTIHYPQDELYFTVNFNVQDGAMLLKSFQDAFNELAEFITVYPDVNAVFRGTLMGIDAETTDQSQFDSAAVALESFNAMVARIVAASAGGGGLVMAQQPRLRGSNQAEPYLFRLKEGAGTVGSETEALVITIIGTPPEGIGNPTVEIPGYTTQPYTGTCNGDFCFYFEDDQGEPLSAAVGQGIGPRTVVLPNMNILQRQDAETTVELKRNVDLVPGRVTAPDFVYTTGEVGFANPLYPLIQYDQEIEIQSVGGGGNRTGTLQELLTEFFAVLLAENTQETLSFLMTCTYAYRLNPVLEPVTLPVVMQPKQSFDVQQPPAGTGDRTLEEMIESWSGSILTWFGEHATSTQQGVLQFDLTIFTNLTEQNMPLLRLSSLVLALQWVTNIPTQE